MTLTTIALVAVAVIAILGAAGAFAVAYRRSQSVEPPEPMIRVSRETRAADRPFTAGVVTAPTIDYLEPEPDGGVAVLTEEAAAEEEELVSVQIVEEQRIVEVSPEEGGVSRRQFFNRALTASFFSFLALQGVYYLTFFWPKLTGGFGADIDAGPVADLKTQVFTSAGAVLPVFIPEARAYIVPAPATLGEQFEGRGVEVEGLMALYMRCVHLGCRVPWCATSQGFECPCHGSKYDYVGEYFAGPAPRNLDRFTVELRGANFWIRTGDIIQTPRAAERIVEYPQGPSCISVVTQA